MKKLLLAASLVVFTPLFVTDLHLETPVQGAQEGTSIDGRVAALEGELAALKQREEESRAQLAQMLVYLDKQSKAAQTLLGVLDESEQQGFAVGENWRSREILLGGLRSYWASAKEGLPKVPPPAQPKPAPVQRKRPAGE